MTVRLMLSGRDPTGSGEVAHAPQTHHQRVERWDPLPTATVDSRHRACGHAGTAQSTPADRRGDSVRRSSARRPKKTVSSPRAPTQSRRSRLVQWDYEHTVAQDGHRGTKRA